MTDKIIERHPVFEGVEMGVGTWAWGDTLYWGYGQEYGSQDLEAVFDYSMSLGIDLFDTSEIYGQGFSETLLGAFLKKTNRPFRIATKFMPFPWRLWKSALRQALTGSLRRLGLKKVDLYQIHRPLPPVSIDTWMEGMVEAFQSGLTAAVGVSNFNREQMLRAYDILAREGIPLASNQVEYSLLNREVEKNGLLKLCEERGITLLAYSPLRLGVLSGKYTPDNPPKGIRGQSFHKDYLSRLQPFIQIMREIGSDHGNRSPAQVALNWVMCKGALPIPGAKLLAQAEQNAGALGWKLNAAEMSRLDEVSDRLNNRQ